MVYLHHIEAANMESSRKQKKFSAMVSMLLLDTVTIMVVFIVLMIHLLQTITILETSGHIIILPLKIKIYSCPL